MRSPRTTAQQRGTSYNPVRGARVVAYGRAFLDQYFPLVRGSHEQATLYQVRDGRLAVATGAGDSGLRTESAFVGYQGAADAPSCLLLRHHGLHVELHIDRLHPIGRNDAAGVCDLVLEAAVSTIQDLEDSVAAVDAATRSQRTATGWD